MTKIQDQAPPMSPEQLEWFKANLEQQKLRHADIVAEMKSLALDRDRWIAEFLERIQERGFNYNCDARRKITEAELPSRPDRPFKVVF